MDVATGVWSSSPQRAAMAVDRLMALRLVSAAAIARWVRGAGLCVQLCSVRTPMGNLIVLAALCLLLSNFMRHTSGMQG